MENQNGRKKKGGSGGLIGVLAAVFLLNIVDTGTGGVLLVGVITVGLLALGIYAIFRAVKKSGNPRTESFRTTVSDFSSRVTGSNARRREEAQVTEHEYIPRREEPQRQYYDSSDVFDNYQRDKEQRIEQLKVFLQNGIIEKDEYMILLKKYQEDTINYR